MHDKRQMLRYLALSLLLLPVGGTSEAAELLGGNDCAYTEQVANVPVSLVNDGSVVALQFDVVYDPGAFTPGAPATSLPLHSVEGNVTSPGTLRVLVYPGSGSMDLIPDGPIAEVPFTIATGSMDDQLVLPAPAAILVNVGAVKRAPTTAPTPAQIDVAMLNQPVAVTECNGASATFDATIDAPGTNAASWTRNGQPIAGGTDGLLTIDVVQFDQVGQYQANVTGDCGTEATDPVALAIDRVCAPQSLIAYDTGMSSNLAFVWAENPSNDITGYDLNWGTQSGGPYPEVLQVPPGNGTSSSDFAVGTRYYFRVNARVDAQQSPSNAVEASALAANDRFVLPSAPDFGFETSPSFDTAHPDVVTYRFGPRNGDVTIWHDLYDVQSVGEVDVLVNGVSFGGTLLTSPASSWTGLDTLVLDDALVNDTGKNVLTFDNLFFPVGVEERWGVRNVSVRLPAPTVSTEAWSQTVDLSISPPANEPSFAGFEVFRSTTPGFTPSPGNRIATGVGVGTFRDDGGLVDVPATTYYYVVRPVDTIANIGFRSVEVSAVPTSAEVTPIVDLRVDKQGVDDLGLEWSAVATDQGVDVYRVYESSFADSVTFTGAETSATSFTRAGDQSDGAVHFYSVFVVDTTGAESTR